VLHQLIDARLVHHEQHEIHFFGAGLESPAALPELQMERSAPSIGRTAAHDALAVLAAENARGFLEIRKYGDAVRLVPDIARNLRFDLLDDFRRVGQAARFVRGSRRNERQSHRRCGSDTQYSAFHGSPRTGTSCNMIAGWPLARSPFVARKPRQPVSDSPPPRHAR